MSKAEIYETKTENLILPILEEMKFELVDIEYVKEGRSTDRGRVRFASSSSGTMNRYSAIRSAATFPKRCRTTTSTLLRSPAAE